VDRALIGQAAFSVSFGRVVTTRDDGKGRSYVFLVPSSGGKRITALHEKMYAGRLRPHLRRDVPYVPHVTLAQKPDHAACVELAAQLDAREPSFHAVIDRIDAISVEDDELVTIETFTLGRSSGTR
jgi:2'-5' RNA ligase